MNNSRDVFIRDKFFGIALCIIGISLDVKKEIDDSNFCITKPYQLHKHRGIENNPNVLKKYNFDIEVIKSLFMQRRRPKNYPYVSRSMTRQ